MHLPPRTKARPPFVLLALLALCTGAMAHTGVDAGAHPHAGFMEGLLHPWTGLDHLGAMVAIGAWSGMTARRWWVAPLAFAGMLLVGALPGLSGTPATAVEPMIASSLVVLGLLLAARAQLPLAAGAALVGLFAVFHGMAHGAELSGATVWWPPLLGMVLSTVALHGIGVAAGLVLRTRSRWWPRLAGAAVALAGGSLLLQMV